jgi:hypothetical protein
VFVVGGFEELPPPPPPPQDINKIESDKDRKIERIEFSSLIIININTFLLLLNRGILTVALIV